MSDSFQDRVDLHRPSDSLDYQRIVEITEELDRWQDQGRDPMERLDLIIDRSAVIKRSVQRTERASAKYRHDAMNHTVVLNLLANAWVESFMFGVRFVQKGGHHKGHRRLSLDMMRLDDIEKELQALYLDRNIEAEYAKRLDLYAVSYVGALKGQLAFALSGGRWKTYKDVVAGAIGVWVEGFTYGARFQELGGHR